MLRHVFVVSRDHVWLYRHLTERFHDDTRVDVILDRRLGERRVVRATIPMERRKGDRRRWQSPDEDLSVHSHYIVEL